MAVISAILVLVVVIIIVPAARQLVRLRSPINLNAECNRFVGPYRNYEVRTFTGYASEHQQFAQTHQVTRAMGEVVGGSVYVRPAGRVQTFHDEFFLTDGSGTAHHVRADSVSPAVGAGHLVSVATLFHHSTQGNSFLVYNHSTDLWYLEYFSSKGSVKGGLHSMVMKLSQRMLVLMVIGIVTIPLAVVIGFGAKARITAFKKRGAKPLLAMMEQRAAILAAEQQAAQSAARVASIPTPSDPAAQIRELVALRDSGTLNDAEFQAAKARLLGVGAAPDAHVGWHADPHDPMITRYWDGSQWTSDRRWNGTEGV